jgi:Chromate transporter
LRFAVFTTFWPLGFVAFGGPQAHVAILREHLVTKRDWISEDQFLELYAIGQVSNESESFAPSDPTPNRYLWSNST